MATPRLFVALDTPDAARAAELARAIGTRAGIKIGLEFFAANGPAGIARVRQPGQALFLDLKFHDIPNTVAGACAAATKLGVAMLNVHAGGGRAMLAAARDAVDLRATNAKPLLIAVTVLTSLDDGDMRELGIDATAQAHALRLAKLAQACGLDGVVCAALEARAMREACGAGFKLVTPGIRPADAAKDDQARIVTPEAAIRNGADYLVIGRPVTQAADPAAALAIINASLERMQ
jgi:orotidine-5'-phosphate decarboxylase